jgi:hypothetical protein
MSHVAPAPASPHRSRNRLILIVGVVVVLILAGLAIYHHESLHSKSYRNGSAVGKKLESELAGGSTAFCNGQSDCINQAKQLESESTSNKCKTLVHYSGVLPKGDTASQWVDGCIAGYGAG